MLRKPINIYHEMIKTIYQNYTSNVTELYEIYNAKHPISYAKFRENINVLARNNFINIKEVRTGITGEINTVILATEKGEIAAMNLADSIVDIKEAEEIINKHTTLEHGYFIKQCNKLLTENGFKVFSDYNSCRFVTNLKTQRGRPKKIEADLVINDNGGIIPIECETGKCPSINLINKLTTTKSRFDILFILCPNQKACNKTQKTVNEWLKKKESNEELMVIVVNISSAMKNKNLKTTIREYKDFYMSQIGNKYTTAQN